MPEPSLSIQPAGAAHLPALLGLLEGLFSLESDFAFDAAKAERGLRLLLERGDALVLVAEVGAEAVGLCSVQTLISTAEGGPVGLVEDVVVAPAWRGASVGRRLLLAAEHWASERGLTRLQLLADSGNAPALAFYHRMGWSDTQLVCKRRMLQR
ncbi:MAG: GNAT family N-acetyltransferase [Methylococcaceae bacterium]|nr:MAG: GNAT family N-acetyltransferase [Methylococcaceae bacterium]